MRKLILILIALLFVLSIVYLKYHKDQFFSNNGLALSAPEEYSKLFSDTATHSIFSSLTYTGKGRSSITQFEVEKSPKSEELYTFIVSRVFLERNLSLKEVIKLENNNSINIDDGHIYSMIAGKYTIAYNPDSAHTISQIIFSYSGQHPNVLSNNDSEFYIRFPLDKFSIRYKEHDMPDFYVNAHNSRQFNFPAEVLFLKRDTTVYIINLFPGLKTSLPQGTLDKYLKH